MPTRPLPSDQQHVPPRQSLWPREQSKHDATSVAASNRGHLVRESPTARKAANMFNELVQHHRDDPAPVPGVIRHRINLHGQPISYLEAGRATGGPVVVLVHGLAGNATSWLPVLLRLGEHAHVLVPDLLGHGESAAPHNGDYSVGGHATRLRDLLLRLGLEHTSVVGHSFGGGVAMTFAHQFPERTDTLTLIASGGLGPELSIALRGASLPGVAYAAQTLSRFAPGWVARLAHHGARTLGIASAGELDGLGRAARSLTDPDTRQAFLSTLRATVNWAGQRLDATDRLYLLAALPILLVAGRHDACIPFRHTLCAHQLLPHSRLEVLDAGHFPHTEHPHVLADLLVDFLHTRSRHLTSAPTGDVAGTTRAS
jgi:pimeloyl-ACP methyl ester carboxylesterase